MYYTNISREQHRREEERERERESGKKRRERTGKRINHNFLACLSVFIIIVITFDDTNEIYYYFLNNAFRVIKREEEVDAQTKQKREPGRVP